MRIKNIQIKDFKRFTDLTVSDIPEQAKLVVLVGPNGSGKTSLFEAFNSWYKYKGYGYSGESSYYKKSNNINSPQYYIANVNIEFYNIKQQQEQIKSDFYFRTAYRNEPDFTINELKKQEDPTHNISHQTLMENDISVSKNYQMLISNTLKGIYDENNNNKTVKTLKEELIGKIQEAVTNVFEDLSLNNIGDPLKDGSFYFKKGIVENFHYKNLSAGEKSAFDLLLDLVIKSNYYKDTVYCIDEPEIHMHTSLQSKLLSEMYKLIPENSQLWLSTHSIGMLKEAKKLNDNNPGSVIFIDFSEHNFDSKIELKPSNFDKTIWERFINLAFDDFSGLIAPERIVFCEGDPNGKGNKNFDSKIYNKIFSNKYPTTMFISIGSCNEIENKNNVSMNIIKQIMKGSKIIGLVDLDNKSQNEVNECNKIGIKVLSRRHIESFLLDDEIIKKICDEYNKSDKYEKCIELKKEAINNSIQRGNKKDDIKSASGCIKTAIEKELGLTQSGDKTMSFLLDTVTPLITEDTNVYKELEKIIFNDK